MEFFEFVNGFFTLYCRAGQSQKFSNLQAKIDDLLSQESSTKISASNLEQNCSNLDKGWEVQRLYWRCVSSTLFSIFQAVLLRIWSWNINSEILWQQIINFTVRACNPLTLAHPTFRVVDGLDQGWIRVGSGLDQGWNLVIFRYFECFCSVLVKMQPKISIFLVICIKCGPQIKLGWLPLV